jgi:hypothetical protein
MQMRAIEALLLVTGMDKADPLAQRLLNLIQPYILDGPRPNDCRDVARDSIEKKSASSDAFFEPAKPLTSTERNSNEPIDGLHDSIGLFFRRALASPPSRGYEPLLLKLNFSPVAARICAYLAIRRGHRTAADCRTRIAAVTAIRYLAKPRARWKSIVWHANVLLKAYRESDVLDEIFAGAASAEFARSLETTAAGDKSAQDRLRDIAALVAPTLSISRGRRMSAASAAHELIAEGPWETPRAYTWNVFDEDFTDEFTKATRIEFGDPEFDPRPAVRRARGPKK